MDLSLQLYCEELCACHTETISTVKYYQRELFAASLSLMLALYFHSRFSTSDFDLLGLSFDLGGTGEQFSCEIIFNWFCRLCIPHILPSSSQRSIIVARLFVIICLHFTRQTFSYEIETLQ